MFTIYYKVVYVYVLINFIQSITIILFKNFYICIWDLSFIDVNKNRFFLRIADWKNEIKFIMFYEKLSIQLQEDIAKIMQQVLQKFCNRKIALGELYLH